MAATRPDPFGLAASAGTVLLMLGVGMRLMARLDGEPLIPENLQTWWRRLSAPTPSRTPTPPLEDPDPMPRTATRASAPAAMGAAGWRRTAYLPPDRFDAFADAVIRLAYTIAAHPHTADHALMQVELCSDNRRDPRLVYFWAATDQLLGVPVALWPPHNTWPGLLAVPQDGPVWRDPDDTARHADARTGAWCARGELVIAGDPWVPVDDGVHEHPPIYRQPPLDALAAVAARLRPARGEYLQAVVGFQPLPPHEVTQVRAILAELAPRAETYRHKAHLVGQGGPLWNVQVLLRAWADDPGRAEQVLAEAAHAWTAYDGDNTWQLVPGPPAERPRGFAGRRWAAEADRFDARCVGAWAPIHPMVLSSIEAGLLLTPPTSACTAPNIRRQPAAAPVVGPGSRTPPAAGSRPGLIDAEVPAAPAEVARPAAGGAPIQPPPPLTSLPSASGSLAATLGGVSPDEVLTRVLAQFEVEAIVTGATRGPVVTLYEISLGPRTKVKRVLDLEDDIRVAYGVERVRVFAPIPGRPGTVGVEIPHQPGNRAKVHLDEVLFAGGRPRIDDDDRPPLLVGLGAGLTGGPVLADLATLPHLLIAGATGSGKALALDTPIPTPAGWTTMGELRDGDMVFGADGRPTKVVNAHDVLLDEPCYEVEFDDGTVIVASGDHLWTTTDRFARISQARGARQDAKSSAARDRLATLDSLIARSDPDELVTAAQLADAVDGLSVGYVHTIIKRDKIRPAGSVSMMMQQRYQAIGKTVTKARWASTNRRGDLLAALRARAHQRALGQRDKRTGSRVVTTEQIRDTLRVGPHVNHSVQVCAPADYPEQDLPVDPYVLGCWLGDGRSSDSRFSCADPEIIDHIRAAGFTVTKQATRHFWGIADLTSRLRRLGVLNNKHVPGVYLRASSKQRLAFLQGLMDTDGHCTTQGSVEFTNTNRRLAEAVVELAVSLGHKAVLREGRATLNGRDCGPKYRVMWTPPDPVFRLSRKLARQRLVGHRGVQAVRYIVDVRPVPSRPVRCITVDASDHLYLASRSYVPTHNSVGLNVAVTSLVVRNRPAQVRLILIDTKQVELAPYAGLPHLIRPLVTTPDDAQAALGWAVAEMERRYDLLRSAGVRHITTYNATAAEADRDPVPYLIIVIDELADLMMAAADHDDERVVRRRKRIEDAIVRVAQKARAVGIHLIIATQRPTVDVVTGLISANIPARVAFKVAKGSDSKVALDQPGAEKLIGGGDLLYLDGTSSMPVRVQGSWVSDKEVEQAVARVIVRDAAFGPGPGPGRG